MDFLCSTFSPIFQKLSRFSASINAKIDLLHLLLNLTKLTFFPRKNCFYCKMDTKKDLKWSYIVGLLKNWKSVTQKDQTRLFWVEIFISKCDFSRLPLKSSMALMLFIAVYRDTCSKSWVTFMHWLPYDDQKTALRKRKVAWLTALFIRFFFLSSF